MKIVEVIPFLTQGGGQRFVVDLCNELCKKHEVTLIVLMSLDEYGLFENELDSRINVISMNKKVGFSLKLFYSLYKIIKNLTPDIVHTHLRSFNYGLLSYLLNRKVKYIHTVHNDAEKEASDRFSTFVRKLSFNLLGVKAVTISDESKKSFTEFYGLDSNLIYNGRPGYNGISSEKEQEILNEYNTIKHHKDSIILVNVARLGDAKNQPVLAMAVENLNRRGFHVELVIIGATCQTEIKDEIEAINSRHVVLLGVKTNPRDYMFMADAFCLPSIYEGLPITLLECLSVGTIPICTPVGGMKNVIEDGVNGLFVKSPGQSDIEEAIVRFINMSNDEKAEMKVKSKQSFSKYDMTTCAHQYEDFMNSLIIK